IAGNRDAYATRIWPGGHLREHRRIERTPPATVNEHCKRRLVVATGWKKIDCPAHRRAIRNPQFGVMRTRTIGRSFACPPYEDLRMFRHAGAIVVFDFVISGHDSLLQPQ